MSLHSIFRSQNIARLTLTNRFLRPVWLLALLASILVSSGVALAQQTYRKPPKEILDVLNAPLTPSASLSPSRDYMLLAQGVRYPPISELAQPMLRLAGLRINPGTNGLHRAPYYVRLWVKRITDGAETEVSLPRERADRISEVER